MTVTNTATNDVYGSRDFCAPTTLQIELASNEIEYTMAEWLNTTIQVNSIACIKITMSLTTKPEPTETVTMLENGTRRKLTPLCSNSTNVREIKPDSKLGGTTFNNQLANVQKYFNFREYIFKEKERCLGDFIEASVHVDLYNAENSWVCGADCKIKNTASSLNKTIRFLSHSD